MIEKTKGIVLKVIKYRESSAIVEILTEQMGMKSYIINGIYKSKPTYSPSLIQPGSILEMVVYNKESKNINRVKELKASWYPSNSLRSMHHMAVKSFIVEFIQKIMRYEEDSASFFGVVEQILFYLEHEITQVQYIPIYFLSKMTDVLGLKLDLENWPAGYALDYRTGEKTTTLSNLNWVIPEAYIPLFHQLQKADMESVGSLNIGKSDRNKIFNLFLNYLNFHINNFPHLYTPEIYKQLL